MLQTSFIPGLLYIEDDELVQFPVGNGLALLSSTDNWDFCATFPAELSFEICADTKGFIIELWKKGLLWDSILGVLWIPLATVEHGTDEGPGTWWTLHSEVIKKGSEIQGTKTPTSHEILLDVYFALPFDTHKDLDCRGWYRGTPLRGTRHLHQDTYDSLSSMESGLSIQESELRRNKDQADGSSFAKARWARAIQKILQEDVQQSEILQDLQNPFRIWV
ncbi:protein unc-13 homolog A-like [Caloenas nicobarica]|uniref:protein unc-13 homolog A-like n=1 Tax=Caloenas nicobarica TaxID=187106 RepID=UPI0032B71B41